MSATVKIGSVVATIRGGTWTADTEAPTGMLTMLQRYTNAWQPSGYVADLDLARAIEVMRLWNGQLVSYQSERTEAEDSGRIF